ncbi:MAG: DUF6445 family protein [Parasphingorhabdus sp.]|uniref:DUF6445 family protein n=1 Tax=Parasphingorhabdus sp. TaxID=2709688 RepID=UPI003298F7A4
MLPALLIIDDFLSDPDVARKAAMALDYDPTRKEGNYPGHISTQSLVIKGLQKRVSDIINVPVEPAKGTSHGHCRITVKGDKGRSGVHIDPAFYSGILYLSLPEHSAGGTEFFRHKRTGLDRVPTDSLGIVNAGYADINALIADIVNRDTRNPSKWRREMVVPMRYNRLILFSPWLFHNSGPAFGTNIENGRLVQLMFFAKT